jgi:Uma2 family endonuclease
MGLDHGAILVTLGYFAKKWIGETGAPFGAAMTPSFWLTDRQMRIPDLAIFRKETVAAMPEFRGGLRGCPEVAVEVISDNERIADVERKTKLYLDSGARAVWNVYPQSETIVVRRSGGGASMLSPGEFLEAPDLLPGLRIPVAALFEDIPRGLPEADQAE